MSETNKSIRLNKLAKEFNVSIDRVLSFLQNKGVKDIKPSSKVNHDLYMELLGEFQPDLKAKLAADLASKEREEKREAQRKIEEQRLKEKEEAYQAKIAKEKLIQKEKEVQENKEKSKDSLDGDIETTSNIIKAEAKKLVGPKITGKTIDLDKIDSKRSPVASSNSKDESLKKKRKRITNKINTNKFSKNRKPNKKSNVVEIDPEEAQKRVRETLAKLQGGGKKSSVKNRREKRL